MSESEKTLISIIIPVFNAEKYLERSVDSVLNQSYKNLEIILVDDGSTDGSDVICNEYALKDSRIKVIHKENGGVAEARNTGLANATGEYISFVDSDDLIHPEMIQRLYLEIIKHQCDISACGYWSYWENEKIDVEKKTKNATERILEGKNTVDVFDLKGEVSFNSVWAKLFKTSLFESVKFPVFRTAEDLFVSFQLCLKAKKFILHMSSIISIF